MQYLGKQSERPPPTKRWTVPSTKPPSPKYKLPNYSKRGRGRGRRIPKNRSKSSKKQQSITSYVPPSPPSVSTVTTSKMATRVVITNDDDETSSEPALTMEMAMYPAPLMDLVDQIKSQRSILLDMFIVVLQDVWNAMGTPKHEGSGCKRSKTACSTTMKHVRKVVEEESVSYDNIAIDFAHHRAPKEELLHFHDRMEIIKDGSGNNVLYLQRGVFPFVLGFTQESVGKGMIHIARILHHNCISPQDFTFTEFSVHGTYSEHPHNAWVIIRGTRVG